jgi:DNA-directed RNA polymerase subunit RPC12/RpoP
LSSLSKKGEQFVKEEGGCDYCGTRIVLKSAPAEHLGATSKPLTTVDQFYTVTFSPQSNRRSDAAEA